MNNEAQDNREPKSASDLFLSPELSKADSVLAVVLNWNAARETIECLASILNSSYAALDIVIVDNGSDEAVVQEIAGGMRQTKRRSHVRLARDPFGPPVSAGDLLLLRVDDNEGFAGGMNHALRRAMKWGYGWVLLVNNDCRISPNLVADLLGAASVRPRAGIVGCKVLDAAADEAVLFGAGRMMFELGAHLFWRTSSATGTIRVNFVTFAVAFISVAMLRDVGLLEERFFMYVEDVQLCYRAAKRGWQLFVDLDVAVHHARSTSLGNRSPGYYYYVTRNTLMFIRDEMPMVQRLVSMMAFLLETTLRWAFFLVRRQRTHARAVWLGAAHFTSGYSGRAPLELHGSAPPQRT